MGQLTLWDIKSVEIHADSLLRERFSKHKAESVGNSTENAMTMRDFPSLSCKGAMKSIFALKTLRGALMY